LLEGEDAHGDTAITNDVPQSIPSSSRRTESEHPQCWVPAIRRREDTRSEDVPPRIGKDCRKRGLGARVVRRDTPVLLPLTEFVLIETIDCVEVPIGVSASDH
jgi:hypothetical protein